MRELIKCYHMFMPRMWEKLLLYLIYPVALIGFGCKMEEIMSPMGVIFVCELIVPAELVLDSLIFGGISSKDTNKLEYLKTSVKGMTVLKKSIIADAVRRVLTVAMILVVVYAGNRTELSTAQAAMCILLSFLLSELMLQVTRHFPSMIVMVAGMCVASSLNMLVLGAVCTIDVPVWGSCLAAVLCIVVAAAGRAMIMRNARKSYYDSRD